MKLMVYLERIELMHNLITARRTGSPSELANRLGISVSRLARIIEFLRDQGAPICYDRGLRSYYYQYPYDIHISIRFG